MKDFFKWIQAKIYINNRELPESFFFREREVWWCSLGVNVDVETDGKNEYFERPVLILKIFSKSFLWVLPITSKIKNDRFHFKFIENGINYCVILTQIRSISSKRLLRKIFTISEIEFIEIITKVISYLKNETPAISGGISEPEGVYVSSLSDIEFMSIEKDIEDYMNSEDNRI